MSLLKSNRTLAVFVLNGLLLLAILTNVQAQVTIRILKVPKNTQPSDSIFIAGSFNNWNSRDVGMRLIPSEDGTYSITFSPTAKYFEYKFTRGDWTSVEGDQNGGTIPNRTITYLGTPSTVQATVESWMDYETIKIRVDDLPSNTPNDAALYMTGPFNNWDPADPNYRLERLENGIYQYVMPHRDNISFKFTRGSFNAIESDENGSPIPARILAPSKLKLKATSYAIKGWEDLSENPGNNFENALLVCAFIGFFFSIGLYSIKNAKRETNNLLSIALVIISIMLTIKILLHYQLFYYQFPKVVLLPLFLLFAISPLINVYARSVLHYYDRISIKEYFIFFTPLIILILGLLPLLTADKNHLVTMLLNHQIDNNLRVVVGIGIVYNIYYLYSSFKILKSAHHADAISVKRTYKVYIFSLLLIGSAISIMLIATFFISLITSESQRTIVEMAIKICWLGLCFYPLTIAWFIITRPEIFSISTDVGKGKSKDSLSNLKTKLDELMTGKRPFLDPDLSLNVLSDLLHTSPHLLSRLINEDGSMNFYDFINGYRIDEFKNRCENGQHKTMTIIAIANEVGFKSKTTFNRTFKKINGVTPRDYLNTLKDE